MKLDGFGIFVKDMGTMIRFYRDVLGFGIEEDENTENVYLEKGRNALFCYMVERIFEKMAGRPFEYAEKVHGHLR